MSAKQDKIAKEDLQMPPVALNINIPATTEPKNELVQAEQIVSLCKTILSDIDSEKEEINLSFNNFSEMVFNAGDATSASKEALVNLLKLKSDMVDKKMKMAEFMLKAFSKEGPKTVTAHQHNDFHIGGDKRKLFADLDKEDEKNEK